MQVQNQLLQCKAKSLVGTGEAAAIAPGNHSSHDCAFYLLAAVDAVLAEDGSAARGHPDSSQRVAVNLVLLNHPLAFLVLQHRAGSAVDSPFTFK